MPSIFLDADVIFSLCYSKNPQSGANKMLFYAVDNNLKLISSCLVLDEVKRHLPQREYFLRLEDLLSSYHFAILRNVDQNKIKQYEEVVHSKDAHVLAAAVQSKVDYLISYNKKHFLTPEFKKINLPICVMNPKDFIFEVILNFPPQSSNSPLMLGFAGKF